MLSQKKIEIEKARKIAKCKHCHGNGCSACRGYCIFIDQMVDSCIPVDYWYRKAEEFYGEENFKEFLLGYLSDIDKQYVEGFTLCLVGHRGTGKTMGACSMLKKALLKGYSSYYITMVDAVSIMVSGEAYDFRQMIKNVDFMVIDEVDQRFFPSAGSQELYGNHFEYILRTRSQNKLPTIMCTNSENTDDIFSGQFKESFDSLRSQFIKVIRVGGKDARKGAERYE
jgi:DNA replication protein DnaC